MEELDTRLYYLRGRESTETAATVLRILDEATLVPLETKFRKEKGKDGKMHDKEPEWPVQIVKRLRFHLAIMKRLAEGERVSYEESREPREL